MENDLPPSYESSGIPNRNIYPQMKPSEMPPNPPPPVNPAYIIPPNPPSMNIIPGGSTVVVTAPVFGPNPCRVKCVHCLQEVTTEIQPRAGLLTFLLCGALLLLGCWLGCCLIPFCVKGAQDIDHICPNCKKAIGTYTRI